MTFLTWNLTSERGSAPAWLGRALRSRLAGAPALLTGVALGCALPVLVLALWSVAALLRMVAPQILPAPSVVWATGLELLESGDLQSELLVSAGRLAAGFLLGGTLGVVVGLATGLSRTADAYLGPTVRALFLVPSIGWLPFFMLIFGIGETLKVVLIAKTCFLPLMLAVHGAVRAVPERYLDVARVLEMGRLATLRRVILPAIAPALLTGVRLALGKGWQVLVLVEMIASAAGIGYLMTWGRKSFQLDVVLVTIVVVGLTGWLIDHGLARLQRRQAVWAERTVQ